MPVFDDELRLLTDQLSASYRKAWQVVVDEQRQVAFGMAANPRLWRRRDRLIEMRERIEFEMANVDATARGWLTRTFPRYYAKGAAEAAAKLGNPFAWTQPHREAVVLLTRDLHDDLLEATRHVAEDTKRFIREVTRENVITGQLVGQTARQTARNVTDFLGKRGIHAVRYANGARFPLDAYAEMAVRTKTAVAYNMGTLNQGNEFGVKYYEIFDGPFCGLESHDDPRAANGRIVTASVAFNHPIAHPNCARSFGARPDLSTAAEARKAEPTEGGQPDVRTAAAVAATARAREAAGLQNRPRTPQRVLERRAALLQRRTPVRAARAARVASAATTVAPPITPPVLPPAPPPPGRINWDDMDSNQAVADALKAKYPGLRVKGFVSKYVDLKQAVDVARTYEQMADAFPEIAKEVRELRFANLSGGVLGQASRQGQYLEVNNAYIRASFDRITRESYEAGFLSQPGVAGTIRHEFGHHIDYYLGRVVSGEGRYAYGAHEKAMAYWVRDQLAAYYNVAPEIAAKLPAKGSIMWEKVKADLSQYGTTNAKEFMAEVIAEATGGSPRPLAAYIFARLREVLASRPPLP